MPTLLNEQIIITIRNRCCEGRGGSITKTIIGSEPSRSHCNLFCRYQPITEGNVYMLTLPLLNLFTKLSLVERILKFNEMKAV